jgi:hypothetical protein
MRTRAARPQARWNKLPLDQQLTHIRQGFELIHDVYLVPLLDQHAVLHPLQAARGSGMSGR